MTCAEEHKFSFVAIPAVSSGIFNFPVSICADVVVTTIKKYFEHKNRTSPPFEIHLVKNDDPTVKEVERAFKDILLEPLSDVRRTASIPIFKV